MLTFTKHFSKIYGGGCAMVNFEEKVLELLANMQKQITNIEQKTELIQKEQQEIKQEMQMMKKEQQEIKQEMQMMKKEQQEIKQEMQMMKKEQQEIKQGMQIMKKEQQEIKQKTQTIEKKLEEIVQDQENMMKDIEQLKSLRIVDSNNIAKILIEQIKIRKKLNKHRSLDRVQYKELDYRITKIEENIS